MKTLKDLCSILEIQELHNFNQELSFTSIEVDSRQVEDGGLFICIRGEKNDGHHYAKKAVEAGAVAIVCEEPLSLNVPQIIVTDTQEAIKRISVWFYENPSNKLQMIGITGTNGKTTTSYLVHHILSYNGVKTGMIGTVDINNGNEVIGAHLTTPQPNELQHHLHSMVDNGCRAAVMEVSSHALAFGRVASVAYDIAGFTNLTQDHLDYHITMENYRNTKGLLFARSPKGSVINFDDAAAQYMAKQASGPVIGYSAKTRLPEGISATDIVLGAFATQFNLHFAGQVYPLNSHLIGLFNVYNVLLAFGLSVISGLTPQQVCIAIETFKPVAGRFMTVPITANFAVIVDYAHSPDALKNVLSTARHITKGKLIVVFGCGGDRDRTKRPIMGQIACQNSDIVVLTSDNPRTEDQNQIIRDVLEGIPEGYHIHIEVQRRQAIKVALELADEGDIIMIAGKGHETYQILNDGVIDFNDYEVVKELWKEISANENMDS